MSCYHHLSIEEREKILKYHSQGKSIREISRLLKRNASTVSRELKRNAGGSNDYYPSIAQKQYARRRRRCVRHYLLKEYPETARMVRWLIVHLWWSPEQAAKRLEAEGYPHRVSTSTIYRAFSNGCLSSSMRDHLRRSKTLGKHKGPGKCASKAGFKSIHERPEAANNRSEPGHLEGDTIFLRKQKQFILTVVDRCTRMLYTKLVNCKDASCVRDAMRSLLSQLPAAHRKTLTLDRGSEFALLHELQQELQLQCFLCDPGSPRQRATNENSNGLLRQFYPKHSVSFSPELSLDHFTSLLNLRPRKSLAWLSPYELHSNTLLHFT